MMSPLRRRERPLSIGRAFVIGAVLGSIAGLFVGWWSYGAFEMGRFSGHVLGGLFILGFAAMAATALVNWFRRNPL